MKSLERNMTVEEAKEFLEKYKTVRIITNVHVTTYLNCYYLLMEYLEDFIFYPTVRKIKSFDRWERVIEKEEQSLPGYAFLLTPTSDIEISCILRNKPTAFQFLSNDNYEPYIIPHNEFLNCVKKMCIDEEEKEWEDEIKKGETLYFTSGPWQNLGGIAIEDQKGDSVKMQINMFNKETTAVFNVKNLRRGMQ